MRGCRCGSGRRAADPAGGARVEPGARRRAVPGLRGRAHHLRPPLRPRPPGLAGTCSTTLGVAKGDRVAIAMRNFPEWSIAFWAATAAGGVAVPLNAWWTGRRAGVRHGRTRAPGCCSATPSAPSGWRRRRPARPRRVVVAKATGRAAPEGARRFDDVLGDGRRRRRAARRRARPRGRRHDLLHVRHDRASPRGRSAPTATSARTSMSLAFGAAARGAALGRRPGGAGRPRGGPNAYLLTVPLFHATGLPLDPRGQPRPSAAKLVIMYKWDPERALELIERERVTTFGGVPTMVWQVLESPRLRQAGHLERRSPSATAARRRRPSWCGASSAHVPRPHARATATA